ncbi:MAG: hypothetical protein V4628_17870, partial [Pseudomonadota bacterium]
MQQTHLGYRSPLSLAVLRLGAVTVLCCCMLAATQAHAQAVMGDKIITVPKLSGEGELRIDGKLDEPQWADALVVEDLHQYQPYEYSEPSQNTKVWIFYTAEALYVAAFFEETDPSLISASVLRQGEGLTA